jgi:hypothetical protein
MLASDVDLVEVMRQVAATDPATCDADELRSLAQGAHRLDAGSTRSTQQ